jgi:hypothetical protein
MVIFVERLIGTAGIDGYVFLPSKGSFEWESFDDMVSMRPQLARIDGLSLG